MSKLQTKTGISTSAVGFWIYLMTDCVLFGCLFAAFALFRHASHGDHGVTFNMNFVLIESFVLLISSATSGAVVAAVRQSKRLREILGWLAATAILGAIFLTMELSEFHSLVADGDSWRASAALSSYFTLVGTHGLHIAVGLIWATVLAVTLVKKGLTTHLGHKLELFATYWHFLDVIWVFIFAVVYMMGRL